MLTYLHKLSAVLFYIWGLSFFGAYLLVRNEIGAFVPRLWLEIGDLPFLIVGMLYGGTSLYLSVKPKEKHNKVLAIFIIVPLLALFCFLAAMNFWPST